MDVHEIYTGAVAEASDKIRKEHPDLRQVVVSVMAEETVRYHCIVERQNLVEELGYVRLLLESTGGVTTSRSHSLGLSRLVLKERIYVMDELLDIALQNNGQTNDGYQGSLL